MPPPEEPEVEWEVRELFRGSYKKYLATNPDIKEAMTEFNRCKRAKPAEQLPGRMSDHKLDGPLKGIMDCHLDNDVILLYKPLANGAVELLLVCNHSDIKGKKATTTAKRIK
jgi:mRNA-degrading endonuclease YafQ of YafQ-DinJ toxin-antitoxin module